VYVADRPLTLEQFYELVDEDSNAELVDGVIVMTTPASTPHEMLFGFLFTLLKLYVEERGLGIVGGSRSVVRISGYSGREPDIFFVRDDRRHIIQTQEITGPPDMIIEIISPGDTQREIISRQTQYEQIGVQEYWRIDQPRRRATIYQLAPIGRFNPVLPKEAGILHSVVVEGFFVREEWLWCEWDKFPPVLTALGELLERV
jgi:Uma2 family endonuclease